MEYIDGGSLNDLINHKGKLNESETICYTKMIAEALQYIHTMNMNHLDVKPANVLLRKNGEVVLIDFGLSKNYDATGEQTTSTPIGLSIGYAPIEQSRIGGVGMFSPATDIYSLGATMFKMLTGEVPPEASVVMDDGLPVMKNVSPNIVKTIEKAMDPRRKSRYQSIDEFLSALGTNNTEEKRPVVASQQSEETLIIKPQETPKFLKEEDKEATRFISDIMVVKSFISTDDVVDLGLSVKWCGHNVGGSKPEDIGDYFSWKEHYDWQADNSNLEIPTRKQFKELIDRCRWSWVTLNGVDGCKITGPSGKSIFLPAAGKKGINGVARNSIFGYYWTSSQAPSYHMAYYLNFDSHDSDLNYEPYATGRNIRLVCK